ncbi:MAG: hypothetical protein J5938_01915 [Clostridia bacterium]|nr:hypothetical protein [Clostridia bacterium]
MPKKKNPADDLVYETKINPENKDLIHTAKKKGSSGEKKKTDQEDYHDYWSDDFSEERDPFDEMDPDPEMMIIYDLISRMVASECENALWQAYAALDEVDSIQAAKRKIRELMKQYR